MVPIPKVLTMELTPTRFHEDQCLDSLFAYDGVDIEKEVNEMFAEDIAKLESELSTKGESLAAVTTLESIKDMKAALVNHKEVQK